MINRQPSKSPFGKVSPLSWRSTAAQLLAACILLQSVAPAAFAAPVEARRRAASQSSLASRAAATFHGWATAAGNFAGGLLAAAGAAPAARENWNVVLTTVSTEFRDHAGLDHHEPSRKLLLSANAPAGEPNSFELVGTDGGHSGFSNVAGLQGEVLVATARDDGQGVSRGGFQPGTLFAGTGAPGAVARVSADGASVQNPWVILPGEAELITGLHVDRTGVFGGDLLVVTAAGGVWRVNSAAAPTRLAALGARLAGVAAVPDDPERYGPWSGKAIVGAKEQASVYAVDAQGQAESLEVGVSPQDIDIVPPHENFFAVDHASRKLLGAAEGAFAGIIGDILITQESPGTVSRLRWDGAGFAVTELAGAAGLKQAAFSPAGVGQIPAVKQVYEKIAVVRHAPVLDSGRVEGTLWQLTGEGALFDGNDTITSDLLVPGTPTVTAQASAAYGGTVEGTESPEPSGYALTIKGHARLRHVVTRTDPIELQDVAFPPATQGTRDVFLRKAGETIGEPATLRHLEVAGHAGAVVVPPGTYGRFTVGGRNALVLGVEGSAEPAVYNLEELALTGGSELRLAGPVTLRVRNKVTLAGSTVGAADDPKRLLLEVADGAVGDAVKVSGNGVLYGIVRAPRGDISIEGNGRLRGTVACDYLFVDGNGVLQITENDIPPPPVNRPPSVNSGPAHTITLPADTVALEGAASDDGLPAGSALAVRWTKVSGPGSVTFADPSSAATTATLAEPGEYVLKLTASDGQLSSSDTTTVTVIPRNQAPVVEAGPEQTVELPAPAELRGTVTDDALPRGSTVTSVWSVVEGPGPVSFADPQAAATTATFSQPGAYTLRLSASDTEFTVSDDVVVNVVGNDAPAVNAGDDQEVTLPSVVTLSGTATDDGRPGGVALEVSWSQTSGPARAIFHDAFAAATRVTFTAPGAYVLRLTASDSQLSASDELTVVVHPRPDGPPEITSEPVTEFLLGAVPTGGGEIVNLAPWTVVQYEFGAGSQPNASWQRDATNSVVTQTINADASILLSDFNLSNAQMEGTWRVNTSSDDDFIGFVFGYQNPEHFYLFDWKQASQDGADRGMSLKVVNADSPLTGDDVWPTAGSGSRVRTLFHNNIGWAEFTDYQFTLQFHPGEIRITVKRGATVLADFTVNDATYTNGRFGFYNHSQAQVRYSGFRRLSLARGTYTYDVEAADPDADPLTYSLDAAPLGMTIDPATGFINWPVSSAAAGDHQVVVRARSPNGAFDTQAYTLTILNPNRPPDVNAGDDRLITTGGSAALNGTAADDGFPRNSTLAVSWSKVDGPGAVTFANPSSAATTATFGQSGSYLLRLTASDGEHTSSDEVTVVVNTPPVVNAGADQTLAQSNTVVLGGAVSDDGVPSGGALTILWSQLSGPGVVSFESAGSPATRAIFPGPGTYTLRLSGNDSLHDAADDVTVVVNASPALDGATLALAPGNIGPYATGSTQPLRAALRGSAGNPLAGYGVEFEVTGPNATTGSAVTDASGVATFSYSGANVGTDNVRAFVRNHAAAIASPDVAMTWAQAANSPPAVQGWIGAPLDGSTATAVVPVTVGAGVTLAQATVEYWPAANPSAVTALAAGAQGGPGATLAALDTTTLANGNYVIRLRATDSAGQQLVSQVTITVAGENKPGRMIVSVTDLTVPAAGIPVTIERRYDSLERHTVGDFGHGWSLEMAGPRLEVSPDHDVTITEPGTGRRVTFQFAPTAFGFPFSFLHQPAYAPEPGVYGKLAANGCGTLIRTSGGVTCYLSASPYRPTVYTYTDPYGRVYTMTAAGKMQSIRDLNGNTLTFSAAGITSSAGNLNVPFARDAQGRITQITDPEGRAYRYSYDAAGDLSAVELPGVDTPAGYTYAPGHLLLSAKDSRGNTEQTTTYYPDGRLASATDAVGNTTRYEYDPAQGVTRQINPDGGVETEKYDAGGLLLAQTDALGQTTAYTYDANRNRLTETDALGQTTRYTYDAAGNVTSIVFPQGRTIRGTYNRHGQPLTDVDGLGNTRTVVYDANSSPVSISDAAGTLVTFTYDGAGNPLTKTDGNGLTTRYTYDAAGNVLTETDPLGRTTARAYDPLGRLLAVTDPRGAVTRYAYDPLGRLLAVTDALDRVTRYEYDANGNRTAQADAAGRRTTYVYDAANRLVRVNHPNDTFVTYTYDHRDQRLTATDESGRTTRFEYDLAGRLVKTIHPDSAEVTTQYDAVGRVAARIDERGNRTSYAYDPSCGCSDRVTQVTDAAGRVTRFEFDAAGRRVAFTDAKEATTRYAYDARGRLTETTYPDGSTVKRAYDGADRLLAATDQSGRVTRFAYDGAGALVSVTDALDRTTAYAYDAAHNLLAQTDALDRTTRYEYDLLGRRTRRTLPLGQSESFAYDEAGNLRTRVNFNGRATTYAYDARDRLTSKVPAAALAEPTVSYTYTPTGERATMTDASGTTAYAYDARDRLTSKQTPQGTLAYTYDSADNVLAVRSSNAGGLSVDYAYDALNRLETVTDNRLASGTTAYAYDAVGNLTSVTLPNGARSDYSYNSLNRLTNLTATRGGTLASYAYTHAPTGQRLSVTEHTGRTVSYSYDAVNRLVGEAVTGAADPAQNGQVGYTLDPVGNRLARSSTLAGVPGTADAYDANDRLVSDAYDANGNTRASGGRTFAYDFEDRIRSADGGAVRLVYDGDGNLAAKTVGGVTTRFLVDTDGPTDYAQVVEEVVGGETVRAYTYGHDLISQRRLAGGNWATSFYGYDGQGSVRYLTDPSGAVTDSYDYDAFGNLVARAGATANDYLYRGERFDADLGLYFLRARHYDQQRGRFLSQDGFEGFAADPLSLHKYLYAHADPANNSDPSGYATIGDYARIVLAISIRVLTRVLPRIARIIICIFFTAASAISNNPYVQAVSSIGELVFCGRWRPRAPRPGRGGGGGGRILPFV